MWVSEMLPEKLTYVCDSKPKLSQESAANSCSKISFRLTEGKWLDEALPQSRASQKAPLLRCYMVTEVEAHKSQRKGLQN